MPAFVLKRIVYTSHTYIQIMWEGGFFGGKKTWGVKRREAPFEKKMKNNRKGTVKKMLKMSQKLPKNRSKKAQLCDPKSRNSTILQFHQPNTKEKFWCRCLIKLKKSLLTRDELLNGIVRHVQRLQIILVDSFDTVCHFWSYCVNLK